MNERRFDECKLLNYKKLGNEQDFEEIMKDKDLKRYIHYVCHQKLRSYPSSLMSFEDFVNISYLIVWQSIQNYKFICPECKSEIKSEVIYKNHTTKNHGKFVEPEKSISEYLKFNLGAYLQNELRREYSSSRKSNVMSINIFSPNLDEENDNSYSIEFDLTNNINDFSSNNIDDEIIFKNCINELVCKFDSITKEIFIYLYKHNMKQVEIAKLLFDQDRYASEQSAAVVVSRTIKNKIYPVMREFFK